jgi:lysophospholipase L1-like esterase
MLRTKVRFLFTCIAFCILLTGCGSNGGDFSYVAMGASDVLGVGATPPSNGYVFLIRDGLEVDGKDTDLTPLGIPGAQAGAIEDNELPLALREDPDLVTLWTGSNDIIDGDDAEQFRMHLSSILGDLKSKTAATVVVGDIPDITQVPRFLDNPDPNVTRERIAAFNAVIRDVANQFNVAVAPVSSITPTDDLVSDSDGFHPNDQGHRKIADIFLQVIRAQNAGL